MWDGRIKVISGVRHCGKTEFLFGLFKDYLVSQGTREENILQVRLEQTRHYKYRNPYEFANFVESTVAEKRKQKFYLFVDEAGLLAKTVDEKSSGVNILNKIKSNRNLDIYVTVSSLTRLPEWIVSDATQIHLFPLSFEEFYLQNGGSEHKALEEYMLYGGLPHILKLPEWQEKKDYLTTIYGEYIKCIINQDGIERDDTFVLTLSFLASSTGIVTNPSNISRLINALGKGKANGNLITRHVEALKDFFLISAARRFDVKKECYLKEKAKYYFSDVGLRNSRLDFIWTDRGQIVENVVFNELIRRGYQVDIGIVKDKTNNQDRNREVGFVVNDGKNRAYVKAVFRTNNGLELIPLYLIKDPLKKIIVRADIAKNFRDAKGIFHCKLTDFLLGRMEIF